MASFSLHLYNRGSGTIVVRNPIILGDFTPSNLSIPDCQFILNQSNPTDISGGNFIPVHPGHYEGVLKFPSDAPGCPEFVITLKAEVVGPEIEVSPPSCDFGEVNLGAINQQRIRLTNTGGSIAYVEIDSEIKTEQPMCQFSCSALGNLAQVRCLGKLFCMPIFFNKFMAIINLLNFIQYSC